MTSHTISLRGTGDAAFWSVSLSAPSAAVRE